MSILNKEEIIIIVASILATIFIIIMVKMCCSNDRNYYKPTFSDISESLKNVNIINNEKARLI
jgi:hypothetical protein